MICKTIDDVRKVVKEKDISFIQFWFTDVLGVPKSFAITPSELEEGLTEGMGFDDRLGGKFLNAGIGFGDSCLPKDLRALITSSSKKAYEAKLLKEVLRLNDRQALRPVELLKKYIS